MTGTHYLAPYTGLCTHMLKRLTQLFGQLGSSATTTNGALALAVVQVYSFYGRRYACSVGRYEVFNTSNIVIGERIDTGSDTLIMSYEEGKSSV